MARFTGKVAIVTGASHNLGLQMAQMMAAEGARVVLASDTYFTHDECVKVLKRYTPIIPEDMKRLGERVVAKHLKAIGYGHLVDKNMGPPLKTILYNHAEGRYFTHEQE